MKPALRLERADRGRILRTRAGWQASHWMMPRFSLAARIFGRGQVSNAVGKVSHEPEKCVGDVRYGSDTDKPFSQDFARQVP